MTMSLFSHNVRAGVTLLELVIALSLIGVLTATAIPRARSRLDAIQVRAAANDVSAIYASARRLALSQATRATVAIDVSSGTLYLIANGDTLRTRPLASLHGVTLWASRAASVYAPTGAAIGGSNLTLVVARGVAAETLWVSRLGRVRR
jgi:prepilin-type N-terminal cleavage/methylation domain-containing protein